AIVLSVLGIHTQDFTSGDFSLAAPQTLAIGPRGIEGRRRATISGNVFDRLRSPELRLVRFPGEHTPGLLFPCRLDPAGRWTTPRSIPRSLPPARRPSGRAPIAEPGWRSGSASSSARWRPAAIS